MKGIKGDLGEMRIVLKLDARPVKHQPYRLNPRVKEKVKMEIDKMLAAGLIFPVEEAEWVSPSPFRIRRTRRRYVSMSTTEV